jgi:hypothetical protein
VRIWETPPPDIESDTSDAAEVPDWSGIKHGLFYGPWNSACNLAVPLTRQADCCTMHP